MTHQAFLNASEHPRSSVEIDEEIDAFRATHGLPGATPSDAIPSDYTSDEREAWIMGVLAVPPEPRAYAA